MITAVAVSGGIDSLITAYLLQQKGRTVFGVHFTTGYETIPCENIINMCAQINLQVHIIDCQAVFRQKVIDYFIKTYQHGFTPNPCLVCNRDIKFGIVLEKARQLGAEQLATGHYVRYEKGQLLKGFDPIKDQSYFLGCVPLSKLMQACFPLGRMTKTQVRQLADQIKLQPAAVRESQDVCFIPQDEHYSRLLEPRPGLIENLNGEIIGKHQGLHLFTIGQRRGINCPAARPYYVVAMDSRRNRLQVGFKEDLFTNQCRVGQINWTRPVPSQAVKAQVRLRYRHQAATAIITPTGTKVIVKFEKPQSAVTPGQAAVFYQGDVVLGGGWIED